MKPIGILESPSLDVPDPTCVSHFTKSQRSIAIVEFDWSGESIPDLPVAVCSKEVVVIPHKSREGLLFRTLYSFECMYPGVYLQLTAEIGLHGAGYA